MSLGQAVHLWELQLEVFTLWSGCHQSLKTLRHRPVQDCSLVKPGNNYVALPGPYAVLLRQGKPFTSPLSPVSQH